MNKKTVFDQKQERDRLLGLSYISREKLSSCQKMLDSNLIKVILGPRRAGKSVFALELLKNKNFAYLNFEDEKLDEIKDYDKIISLILEVYDNPKYLLFDEIQHLPKWEMWCNKLQRRGFNVILTGSNSNLLNGELASSLTGRYFQIEIYPFSFKEYLKVKNVDLQNEDHISKSLSDYLNTGGFPEVVTGDFDFKSYLQTMMDATIYKDILKRHQIGKPARIAQLKDYLLANCTNLYSINSLQKVLDDSSFATVERYVGFLEEVYLMTSLTRFSYKYKEQIKAPRKIYTVDNGFIKTGFSFSPDFGKLMENLVFNYYRQQGFAPNRYLYYYKTRTDKEVDFVLKQDLKIKQLVQVCYDPEESETLKRELLGLAMASEELSCDELFVITWEVEKEIKFKNKTVKFLPLWKSLLK